MGIIVTDTFVSPFTKQSISGSYIGMQGEKEVTIRKDGDGYRIRGHFLTYFSKAARMEGARAIQGSHVELNLAKKDMAIDIYDALYTELKKKYVTTEDVLEEPKEEEPVEEPKEDPVEEV